MALWPPLSLLCLGEGDWPPNISLECSLECQEFALFPPLGFTTRIQITGKNAAI